MNFTFRKINEDEIFFLEEIPNQLELDEIIASFPKDKSPGLDGMTFEVIQGCWEFIGPDFRKFTQEFWAIGNFPY